MPSPKSAYFSFSLPTNFAAAPGPPRLRRVDRVCFLLPLSSRVPDTPFVHHASPHYISLSICVLGLSSPTHARDSDLASAVLAALFGKLSLPERMKNPSPAVTPICECFSVRNSIANLTPAPKGAAEERGTHKRTLPSLHELHPPLTRFP